MGEKPVIGWAYFALVYVAMFIATAMLYKELLKGAEWVSFVSWAISALILGQAGGVIAAGFTAVTLAKITKESKS